MSGNSRQTRGETSELEVAMHLIEEHGCRVSQTFGHGHSYDLIADKEGNLLRIQVKTASNNNGNQQGADVDNPNYSAENIDMFAGQPKTHNEPFFVPTEEVNLEKNNPRIHVTYTPRENMGHESNWESSYHISDYTFDEALQRWQEQDFLHRTM